MAPNKVIGLLETLGAAIALVLGVVHQVSPETLSSWPAVFSALAAFVMHALNHGPGGTA